MVLRFYIHALFLKYQFPFQFENARMRKIKENYLDEVQSTHEIKDTIFTKFQVSYFFWLASDLMSSQWVKMAGSLFLLIGGIKYLVALFVMFIFLFIISSIIFSAFIIQKQIIHSQD